MPFQKFELHKNYDLMLVRPKPKGSGFEQDELCEKKGLGFFPKTYYKYNNKYYIQDNSVLEYDKSIIYKKLICTDNELDIVIFYDKKEFDLSVERTHSFKRPKNSNSNNKVKNTSNKNSTYERTLSDIDIERMFDLC